MRSSRYNVGCSWLSCRWCPIPIRWILVLSAYVQLSCKTRWNITDNIIDHIILFFFRIFGWLDIVSFIRGHRIRQVLVGQRGAGGLISPHRMCYQLIKSGHSPPTRDRKMLHADVIAVPRGITLDLRFAANKS